MQGDGAATRAATKKETVKNTRKEQQIGAGGASPKRGAGEEGAREV